jgi:dihydroorotase
MIVIYFRDLSHIALLVGGIRPHMYCLPILKRENHRLALVQAAISGNPKFFGGTDSAPHPTTAKQSACGCAGIFTAHAAVELYAEVFDRENAIDRLEPFLCQFGADFYGVERSKERKITLQHKPWTVPMEYSFGDETVTPLRAGEAIHWSIVDV